MPPVEPATDGEEKEDAEPPKVPSKEEDVQDAAQPEVSSGPKKTQPCSPDPKLVRVHRLKPRVPKLATIVEHVNTLTYVDGVMIHREDRRRAYYQDVFIDCTRALSRDDHEETK